MWEGGILFSFSFFFYRILSIFNPHTNGKRGENFKEIDNGIYPKGPWEGEIWSNIFVENMFKNLSFDLVGKLLSCQDKSI